MQGWLNISKSVNIFYHTDRTKRKLSYEGFGLLETNRQSVAPAGETGVGLIRKDLSISSTSALMKPKADIQVCFGHCCIAAKKHHGHSSS